MCEEPEKLNFGPFNVPDGCYFMMGDNRNHSYDSRYWDEHYVPIENIIAKHIIFAWGLQNCKNRSISHLDHCCKVFILKA